MGCKQPDGVCRSPNACMMLERCAGTFSTPAEYVPHEGSTQPGMTKGKMVKVIFANGIESQRPYNADGLEWRRRGNEFDIAHWRLAQ